MQLKVGNMIYDLIRRLRLRIIAITLPIALAGCASGTAGTGVINGQAASIEIKEHLKSGGLILDGYDLTLNGQYMGVMECVKSCSGLATGSNIIDMKPLKTTYGIIDMKRIYRSNSIFFEIYLDGEYAGNVRFL